MLPHLRAARRRQQLQSCATSACRATTDGTGSPKFRSLALTIEELVVSGGGGKPEPELDRLSNIIKRFNEQFGTLFKDADRIAQRFKDDIAPKVAADTAYQNAKANTPQTARIEHDKALATVMLDVLKTTPRSTSSPSKTRRSSASLRTWCTNLRWDSSSGPTNGVGRRYRTWARTWGLVQRAGEC